VSSSRVRWTRRRIAVSAEYLRVAGLINRPGQVTIIDRDGLEVVACECYWVVRTALDGVIQRARLRSAARGVSTTKCRDGQWTTSQRPMKHPR
jgi:hypothetical protein